MLPNGRLLHRFWSARPTRPRTHAIVHSLAAAVPQIRLTPGPQGHERVRQGLL